MSAEDEVGTKHGRKLIAVVCAAQFMVMIDVAIVNVALPSIDSDLGFSDTGLQWVVNAYTLSLAGFLMLGGRACDLFGQRRVFLLGLALFTSSSVACAIAGTPATLVGFRALQGIGGAILSPASLTILSSAFPDGHQRNRALGAWAAMGGLGGSVGMLLGGVLTQAFGWPAIFLINVPLGLLVLPICWAMVPAGPRRCPERRIDLAGAVLITAGLTLLVFGIVRSETLDWGSPGVLGPLLGSGLLLALFAAVEWRSPDPLVPPRVLRRPLLRWTNAIVILLYLGAFSVWYFLSLYLQNVRDLDPLETGLAFMPLTFCVAFSTMAAPRLIRRLGVRTVLCLGLVVVGAGLLLLTGIDTDGSYFAQVLPGGIVTTLGLGVALVATTIAALEGAEEGEGGLASALLNTSRLIGGALGVAGFSTLAAARTDILAGAGAEALEALTGGYAAAFLAGGLACLLAAVCAFFFVRTDPAEDRAVLEGAEL